MIHGDFSCSNSHLNRVDGDFYCIDNKITSLEYCPEEINGNFICNGNELTSLEYCPQVVGGNFNCSYNNLISLKGCPQEINGNFIYINKNTIKEDELVNFNCKVKNIKEIHSDFNQDGNVEEFFNKVNYYKNIKKENELLKELSITGSNVKLNKKL